VATAAVRDLAAAGEFGSDDDVAVILTGSGYKYGASDADTSSVREVDRADVPAAVRDAVSW
jgi:threonine synthase